MAEAKASTTPQAPRKTNPSIDRLGILAGKWKVEMSAMSFLDDPAAVMGWHCTFDWVEGGIFIAQHDEEIGPDIPYGTWMIGPDDEAGTYCVLHYDSRGVSRIYQMSLDEKVWKVWRDFPGFSQRFIATISPDGNTMHGGSEKSEDGVNWELDFNLTYTKVTQPDGE